MLKEAHPEISEALNRLKAQEEHLRSITLEIQGDCPHEVVAERPWETYAPPRRICFKCRYEEEGSNYSGGSHWHSTNCNPPKLGNTGDRVIMVMDNSADFYKLRLPI